MNKTTTKKWYLVVFNGSMNQQIDGGKVSKCQTRFIMRRGYRIV